MKIFILVFLLSLQAHALKLSSTSFKNGDKLPLKHVFNGFGCTGENISPSLEWKNAPKDTKSFAITVYDPDAPTGSGWWHWTVVNIPNNVFTLTENSGSSDGKNLPQGAIQGRTDYGFSNYGGACPPVGRKPHKYIFTIWALKVDKLEIDSNSSGALVGYYLNANVIKKDSIRAYYGRK